MRALGSVSLPASLGQVDDLVIDHLHQLDLWLYDYSLTGLRSLRRGTTVQARPPDRSFAPPPPGLPADGGGPDGGDPGRSVPPVPLLRARLLHLGQPLGFVTAMPAGSGSSDGAQRLLDDLAPVLAAAVTTSSAVTDAVEVARRQRPMSLAAEMQWSMLPPVRYETVNLLVSAAVEPAYETGGDVFDYAEGNGRVFLAVLDAMGHGLAAASVSAVALACLRRSRRAGLSLMDMAAEMDHTVRALPTSHYVSAVLVDLDLASGRGAYLSAGHVPPLVVTAGRAQELVLEPALPLGLRIGAVGSRPVVRPLALAPGQTLVLYSDGVVDNQLMGRDEPAGYQRFTRLVARAADGPSLHPARDVVDSLMALTGPQLRDDATLLMARFG